MVRVKRAKSLPDEPGAAPGLQAKGVCWAVSAIVFSVSRTDVRYSSSLDFSEELRLARSDVASVTNESKILLRLRKRKSESDPLLGKRALNASRVSVIRLAGVDGESQERFEVYVGL